MKPEETTPVEFSTTSLNYYMNLQTIMRDNAISPNYLSHLDTVDNFSVGFNCEVNKLNTKEVSKVMVRTRYFFPRYGKASIVCLVSKADSIVFWQAVKLNDTVAINKWETKEALFDLQKTYKDDEVLTAYIWAPDRDELYVEELYVKPIK